MCGTVRRRTYTDMTKESFVNSICEPGMAIQVEGPAVPH